MRAIGKRAYGCHVRQDNSGYGMVVGPGAGIMLSRYHQAGMATGLGAGFVLLHCHDLINKAPHCQLDGFFFSFLEFSFVLSISIACC